MSASGAPPSAVQDDASATAGNTVRVEVVAAFADRALVGRYRIAAPATVRAALEAAAADPQFAAAGPFDANAVGVFGRLAAIDERLEEGDRVELYRALAADPKAARRARVREARRRQ